MSSRFLSHDSWLGRTTARSSNQGYLKNLKSLVDIGRPFLRVSLDKSVFVGATGTEIWAFEGCKGWVSLECVNLKFQSCI